MIQASGGSATGRIFFKRGCVRAPGPKGVANLSPFPQREVTVVQLSNFKLQASTFNVQQLARNGWSSLVAAYNGPEGPRPEHNRGIEEATRGPEKM